MRRGINKNGSETGGDLFLGGNFNDSWFVDDSGGAVALFDDADDPGLASFLLFDVLAIGGGLFAGQADEESAGGFGGVALQELEHVSAGLGHGGHFGDDRQVVDDEGDFVLLVRGQGLGVSEQTEAGDVGGTVRVVLVHEPGGDAVQPGHGVHGAVVGLADVLLGDD